MDQISRTGQQRENYQEMFEHSRLCFCTLKSSKASLDCTMRYSNQHYDGLFDVMSFGHGNQTWSTSLHFGKEAFDAT
eukprot:5973814-Amphidinium_carterae.1